MAEPGNFKPVPIPGYEHFEVDETGDVINTKTGKHITKSKRPNGYLFCGIQANGVRIRPGLHRLVAMAHIPNPENLPVVMHLDNDRTNDNVENLKWGTHSENIKQAYREHRKRITYENLALADNRSYYIIDKENSPIMFSFLGADTASQQIGITKSALYNRVHSQNPICTGPFQGWMATSIDRKTFRDQLLAEAGINALNVEPQA